MQTIKGFVTIGQYIDNQHNALSALAELSTYAATFSKDKGEYQDSTVPGYKLITFDSRDSVSGVEMIVSEQQVLQILQVVKSAVEYATTHIRPYNAVDFKNELTNAYIGQIGTLVLGDFVDNGTLALPEWMTWTNLAGSQEQVKIWLADASFRGQYDGYEIVVIPPLTNLDSLFGSFSAASATIQSRKPHELSDLITTNKDSCPETILRFLEFDYYNFNTQSQKISTTWVVLIYGQAGDNMDSIKDALASYVLAHSSHVRADWEVILPDMMKRTEFVILPRWDKIAIPGMTLTSGLYSSLLDPVESVTFAQANLPFYPDEFIATNVTMMPFDYKALLLLVVNGNANIAGKTQINQVFPDYLPIASTNVDFNRMSISTREWVIILEQLLIEAEKATLYTTVPQNLRRVVRDGVLFLTASYDNVNYLVAARANTFYTGA